jgi:hypothetical protein
MSQTGRPASDITVGSWGTAPLWSKINDGNDGTYISTTTAATTGEVKLDSLDAPIGEGHILTIRAYASGSGGPERLNTWGLIQGSTEIAMQNDSITRNSFNPYTITLSSAQIANISDYTDLRVRFTAAQSNGETLRISNITFVIPDGAPPVDALEANSLDTGTPALGVPDIGQIHVLISIGVDSGTPVLSSPDIGQIHDLIILDLDAGSPILGTPILQELSGEDNLTADGLDTGTPILGTPDITQIHVLIGAGINTSSPEIGISDIGQVHIIEASGIDAGNPVLDTPILSENQPNIDNLIANNLTAGNPVIGSPSIWQIHILVAIGIEAGNITISDSTLAQIHHLSTVNINCSAPTLGNPILAEISGNIDNLIANDLDAGAPILDSPEIRQFHALIVMALNIGGPIMGQPILDEEILLLYDEYHVYGKIKPVIKSKFINIFTQYFTLDSEGTQWISLSDIVNYINNRIEFRNFGYAWTVLMVREICIESELIREDRGEFPHILEGYFGVERK